MSALAGRLDRYLARRTLVTVAMVVVLMVVITLAVDFLVNVGVYMHGDHPGQARLVAELYWYRLPQLANLALPIGMVISSLVVCAPMLKRGEFVALSASGISPARAALAIPVVALLIGLCDAAIADRLSPHAVVETTRISDVMQNANRMGRVWQVPETRSSWFIASAGGLISATPPSVQTVIIASADGLVTADRMIWSDERWQLQGHIARFLVHPDGTCQLLRPRELPLTGGLALPYRPEQLYARLLPRDTMSSADLIRQGDTSDISYAWSRWMRCGMSLVAVLVALPVFVRFLHRDNLIVGVGRGLLAAAVPVAALMAGSLTAEHGHPQVVLPAAMALVLAPCLVIYWRWRL
jgi:lipopolysaccharide export LptBFGC system permease protein LptF